MLKDHGGNVLTGAQSEEDVKAETRFIPPTIIENPRLDSRLMTEEIFGPILPIVTMKNIDEGIKLIRD